METAFTDTVASQRCLRCGRPLTAADSVCNGYGRTCLDHIHQAAATVDTADFKTRQVAKAAELIEQAGLVPTQRPHVFRAVASDGSRSYLTTPNACTCPAGLHGGASGTHRCYHQLAATVLAATRDVPGFAA